MQQKPAMIGWIAATFSMMLVCQSGTLYGQDIAFGERYQIHVSQVHPGVQLDSLVFYEDGSYSRSEFTGTRFMDPVTRAHRKYVIEDLRGNWEWDAGHLHLYDTEIVQCRCLIITEEHPEGVEEPCEVTKDDIMFGAAEWFEGFRVEIRYGKVLKLESLTDFRERTGRK